jgi:hypothetical protein
MRFSLNWRDDTKIWPSVNIVGQSIIGRLRQAAPARWMARENSDNSPFGGRRDARSCSDNKIWYGQGWPLAAGRRPPAAGWEAIGFRLSPPAPRGACLVYRPNHVTTRAVRGSLTPHPLGLTILERPAVGGIRRRTSETCAERVFFATETESISVRF